MTALAAVLTLSFAVGPIGPAVAQEKPNIIFIMGDDIGWSNIGCDGGPVPSQLSAISKRDGRTPQYGPQLGDGRG